MKKQNRYGLLRGIEKTTVARRVLVPPTEKYKYFRTGWAPIRVICAGRPFNAKRFKRDRVPQV